MLQRLSYKLSEHLGKLGVRPRSRASGRAHPQRSPEARPILMLHDCAWYPDSSEATRALSMSCPPPGLRLGKNREESRELLPMPLQGAEGRNGLALYD